MQKTIFLLSFLLFGCSQQSTYTLSIEGECLSPVDYKKMLIEWDETPDFYGTIDGMESSKMILTKSDNSYTIVVFKNSMYCIVLTGKLPKAI